jgi:hypothetical protein
MFRSEKTQICGTSYKVAIKANFFNTQMDVEAGVLGNTPSPTIGGR